MVESPKEYKDAFSEFLKDNLSNIKGAFAPVGTTSEDLYAQIMADYVPKRGGLRMLPVDQTAQTFMQRKKLLDQAKRQQKDLIERKNKIIPPKKPKDPEDKDEYLAENIFWVPEEARWTYIKENW